MRKIDLEHLTLETGLKQGVFNLYSYTDAKRAGFETLDDIYQHYKKGLCFLSIETTEADTADQLTALCQRIDRKEDFVVYALSTEEQEEGSGEEKVSLPALSLKEQEIEAELSKYNLSKMACEFARNFYKEYNRLPMFSILQDYILFSFGKEINTFREATSVVITYPRRSVDQVRSRYGYEETYIEELCEIQRLKFLHGEDKILEHREHWEPYRSLLNFSMASACPGEGLPSSLEELYRQEELKLYPALVFHILAGLFPEEVTLQTTYGLGKREDWRWEETFLVKKSGGSEAAP